MGILNWLKRTPATPQKSSASLTNGARDNSDISANSSKHYAGTYVDVEELIRLQAQARKLDLSQPSFARASTTGSHHSRFRGRGMDYQESRVYQAGDDIRNMDWRVTARAGKPHTKLYQEERERPVVLLVDLNPGMFFGSTKVFKSVLAAQVASLLGWAAALRGDRVGALITGISTTGKNNKQHSHKELPPKMGKRGALQLISELVKQTDPMLVLQTLTNKNDKHSDNVDNNTSNTTNNKNNGNNRFNKELQRLRRIARPGSLIFIISDFYHIDEEMGNHLLHLSRHNDLMAIQIVDPLELNMPPAGRYGVTNGKQSGVLNTRSKKGKRSYQAYFSKHHRIISELMSKQKIPLLQISTNDNPAAVLQKQFGTARQRSSILSKVA